MKVLEEINHPNLPNHTIQFGISTWTESNPVNMQTESVRRAVYNSDGKFSPHGSSEIPLEDFPFIISECVKRGKISRWTLLKMLFV
jgi:hypothetical protein